MLELVRGYATACLDGAELSRSSEAVTSDLRALSRLVVSSDALREVVTDGSISAANRAAVVADLLAGRLAPEALDPFVFAVMSERAPELPKTLERLLEMAEIECARIGAGRSPGAEPPAGRSGGYERIRGYGERVFELQAATSAVEEIEDELFSLARIAAQSPVLRQALADTGAPIERRLAVLADLLGGRVSPSTALLASYVLRAGRSRDVVGALDYLVEVAASERGRRIADVRAAVALDDGERGRMTSALSKMMRRQVELRVRVDPALLGGVRINVGGTVIDGTVRHRLEQLRESLVVRA